MILDTNALSAFAEAHAGAAAMIGKARFIAIPVIVLAEYRFGIAQSRRREEYERWLERLLPDCRVLDIGPEVARKYAEVRLELKRCGTPIPANDAWIAALCRQHVLPTLSQDEHFDLVRGIQRQSW